MATSSHTDSHTCGTHANAQPRLLIADDQPYILEALTLLLRPEGFHVETARTPALVLDCLQHHEYDALLIDLNYTRDTTSGTEGMQLLQQVRQSFDRLPVIVMTAYASVDLAVEAMQRGANDFVQKPWENVRLLSIVKAQVELYRAYRRTLMLEAENDMLRADGAPEFIAAAPSMRPVLNLVRRIGPSNANVLITGEHGTGKEVVAQTLHRLSARAHRTLVAVNTGALPEGTFESELFGHVKGAFTDARGRPHRPLRTRKRRNPLPWTRSPTFPCVSRRSCSASWRRANWSVSAPPLPNTSTHVCSPPPTPTCVPRPLQAASAKIFFFA